MTTVRASAGLGRRAVLVGAPLVVTGCGEKRPATSGARAATTVSAPRAMQPDDYLSEGLDVVMRLDLERLRTVATSQALDPLRDPVGRRLRGGDEASLLDLLRLRARQVWIGSRGLPTEAERLDAVLVAKGSFARFDPSSGSNDAWRKQLTGHPGYALFERTGAPRRSDPSFLAIINGETLVLATTLEAEGVRKRLEQRVATGSPLAVPADGLLGVRLRAATLGRALAAYPHLAAVAQELDEVHASGDLDSGGALRLDVSLGAARDTGGTRIERVLKGWKDAFTSEPEGPLRLIAETTTVERDGPRSVVLKLRATGDRTRQLLTALIG